MDLPKRRPLSDDPRHVPLHDRPCEGCRRPIATSDAAHRLCPDCRAQHLEGLARALDPSSYDPASSHEWAEAAAILARLYPPCWPDVPQPLPPEAE